ncbi:hypothetical protein [Acrocarpospora sp. B8E8]|uniref:hypothetical protein n=1 Tax=Acrocarpospora sp. B8E8 TaxID=3153572 RepID=UPI00325D4B8D
MPGIEPYTAADLERLRSVQVRPQGWTHATHDQVREHRDPRRRPVKVTTDQLGNRIRERWEGQDVRILAPHIRVRFAQEVTR